MMKHKYSKDFFFPQRRHNSKSMALSRGVGQPSTACLSSGSSFAFLPCGPSAHHSSFKRFCFCETFPDRLPPAPRLSRHTSFVLLLGCIRTIIQWMKCGHILADTSYCVTYGHIALAYFPRFSFFGP